MAISEIKRESSPLVRRSEDQDLLPPEPKRAAPIGIIDLDSFISDHLKGLEATLNAQKNEAAATPSHLPQSSHSTTTSATSPTTPNATSNNATSPNTTPTPTSKQQVPPLALPQSSTSPQSPKRAESRALDRSPLSHRAPINTSPRSSKSKRLPNARLLDLPHPRDSIFETNREWAFFSKKDPDCRADWPLGSPMASLKDLAAFIRLTPPHPTWFSPQEDPGGRPNDKLPLIESERRSQSHEIALELVYERHDQVEKRIITSISTAAGSLLATSAILALGDILFATRIAGKHWFRRDAYREVRLLLALKSHKFVTSTLYTLKDMHRDVSSDYSLSVKRRDLFEAHAKNLSSSHPDVYAAWIPSRSFKDSGKARSEYMEGTNERIGNIQASSPPTSPVIRHREYDNPNLLGSTKMLTSAASSPVISHHLSSSSTALPRPLASSSTSLPPQSSDFALPLPAQPAIDQWTMILNFSALQDQPLLQSLIRFLLKRFILPKHETETGSVSRQIENASIFKLFGFFCSHPEIVSITLNEPIVNLESGKIRTGFEIIRHKVLAGCDKSILPRLMDMLTDGIPRCSGFPELAKAIFDPILVSHLPRLGPWLLKMPSMDEMSIVAHSLARATAFAYSVAGSGLNPAECGLHSLIESLKIAQTKFGNLSNSRPSSQDSSLTVKYLLHPSIQTHPCLHRLPQQTFFRL